MDVFNLCSKGNRQVLQRLENTEYYYKECAINARSPENEADEFEKEFILALNENPNLEHKSKVRTIDGKAYLTVLHRGEVMEKSCLRCHSVADAAPERLIKRYGSKRSFQRSENEVVSAISIRVPMSEAYSETKSIFYPLIIFAVEILLLLILILVWLNRFLVIRPLEQFTTQANRIATNPNQLGETIPLNFGKEFNRLAKAFNSMSEALLQNRETLEQQVEERTKELQNALVELEKDVQKRKQAETQLRKSQELLEISQQVSQMGSYEADLANDKVVWSDELFRLYERNSEDYPEPFKNNESAQWSHPEDFQSIHDSIFAAIEHNDTKISLDFRIVLPDDSIRYVHSIHQITYNEENIPIFIHGTLQDITDLKKIEEARKASEKNTAISSRKPRSGFSNTALEEETFRSIQPSQP